MKTKRRQEQKRSAADFLPSKRTLSTLKEAAASCKGCDLYKNATQTVFGEGSRKAKVVLVGEQPGDYEDKQGRPFVGPAGRMLDEALAEAEIPRSEVYVTNAVKHFKWTPLGKRRKHQKPLMSEIMACRPWLEAEMEAVRPKILVCLGATAVQSVTGKNIPIGRERGKFRKTDWAPETFITIHPSAVYRFPEREQQKREYRRLVQELQLVRKKLDEIESVEAAAE